MNKTTIIATVIALSGGFVAGTAVTKVPEGPMGTKYTEATPRNDERPLADDFVSVRPNISNLPEEALSETEISGLLLMREEEKLARDVYQTLYEKWDLQIFANIAQSEQTHTEAVRDLLVKYELTDPVTDDTIGIFTDQKLQQLYTDLVAKGQSSLVAALQVGATVEDLDISDLIKLSTETDNQDIKLVYDNLTWGSRNHLRAFVRQLNIREATYEPQYISVGTYTSIVNSDQEPGTQHNGQGGRGGRGWGGGQHGVRN